jgi:hypothetical protein
MRCGMKKILQEVRLRGREKNRKSFDFIIKCLTEEMRDGWMERMTQTKPKEKQTLEDKNKIVDRKNNEKHVDIKK